MKEEIGFTLSEMNLAINDVWLESKGLAAKKNNFPYRGFSDRFLGPAKKRAMERSGFYWLQTPPHPKTKNFLFDREHTGGIFDELYNTVMADNAVGRRLRRNGITAELLWNAEQYLNDNAESIRERLER